MRISGQIVDVVNSRIFNGTIEIENGKILNIIEESQCQCPSQCQSQIILPGFVDSHVHIESSLLVPTEFARLAVAHGSVASVSDPHEIANVLGIDGVRYMIEVGKKSPFKFYFGAPSCVPATCFETSGATLNSNDIEELMSSADIKYLGEMMNYPGVIFNDDEVMKKIESAHHHNKPIDGHAPLLSGDDLKKYCASGISTDHECSSVEEAMEKISLGMKIQIREGSAANNFDNLISIIKDYPDSVMFCTDDAHPHELIKSHINGLIKRAIYLGYNPLDVIKAATLNPVRHYNLEVGLLQKNDPADFVVIDNFNDFNILKTYINGELVAENGKSLLPDVTVDAINNFVAEKVTADDFKVIDEGKDINIIGVINGELLTEKIIAKTQSHKVQSSSFNLVSDIENDILKIAVINRYEKKKPAVAFIKGIGLKRGALASSVAHDSHNIIVIGCDDESMAKAANMIIENKGGFAVCSDEIKKCLPLPVAGIMTNDDAFKVANDYLEIRDLAKSLGSPLSDPFMTMEFMALLVIPKLKLSDKGLFDCEKFELIPLFR
ncbi:MAG: adenine deaminase [Lentimicrobiaceae bacterium]|nr:adenine deaminase [Lentimicrobiaceae bacterium]